VSDQRVLACQTDLDITVHRPPSMISCRGLRGSGALRGATSARLEGGEGWSGTWSDAAWSETGAAIVPAVRWTDLKGRQLARLTC
jgi:hypothetical protein